MEISITCLDKTMCSALVSALQLMGYSVRVVSTTVSFRFAIPSSHQPDSDVPNLVRSAEVVDQGMVSAYNALSLPNNDPNTIPEAAYKLVKNSVVKHSRDFLINTVVRRAKDVRLDPYIIINGLVQGFKIGVDEATNLVRKAGFPL